MLKSVPFLILAFGFATAALAATTHGEHLRIAAAADLKFALDEVKTEFLKSHPGVEIEIVTGSSGQFEQQIEKGAPFDIFMSADTSYPKMLSEKGLTMATPVQYGVGTLVLWTRAADITRGLAALTEVKIKKIAIANPDHAPYGKAARDALMKVRLWNAVQSKLVLGDSISQTAQFAQTGAADVGLIALALASSPEMKKSGHFVSIPEAVPLEQAMVVLKSASVKKSASEFEAFVVGAHGQATLKSFGFSGLTETAGGSAK